MPSIISTLTSTASANTRAHILRGNAGSRPAVASSSSLLERARARLERSRPWAQPPLGNSRSRASSTVTSQLSFIPPPPLRTAAPRAGSTTSSSGRDSSLSFIPAPSFSHAFARPRSESQRSRQASTVSSTSTRPSLLELTFLAPGLPTTTVPSSQASTLCASASTSSKLTSARTVSSTSKTGSSAHTVSSAITASTGIRTRTRTRTTESAYRTLQASREFRELLRNGLDTRRPSAAPTLSSASSSNRTKASTITTSLSRSLENLSFIAPRTVRSTGTRPPPSTTSSRTDASLLGLSFICPPAKGTRAPSSTNSACSSARSLESLSFIEPPAPQSLPSTSEVLARARTVRAAAELRKASAVDSRKPVSRPPIARQISSLAPSLRHHSFWSAELGSDYFPGRRSPVIPDQSSSSPPPSLPPLQLARKGVLRGTSRECGRSRPVKRVRFGDDHSERELQDVKVTIHPHKRWIGILQFTEPGSLIWKDGMPLCGIGRAIHCYPDPRRIVAGNLVGWELIPGTTDEYGYTFGSSRMAPTSIDNGGPLAYTHKGCSREHTGCNRYPQNHHNANGPPDNDIIRLPEWKMDHVFRPEGRSGGLRTVFDPDFDPEDW